MSYAPSLRAVRAHFALSQLELGAWLGLGRSQLARIEAGHDPLPGHAVPWLMPWLAALAQAPAPTAAAAPEPDPPAPPAGPPALLARLAECRYQARRLGPLLAAQQAHDTAWAARLAAGPLLLAALPPAEAAGPEPAHAPAARRRRWLARLLETAADEQAPAATAATLLAARRHAWQQEAAWLAAHLAAGLPE